jgi:uncharacterized protein YcbX
MPTVARINVTPVKALGLQHPAEVELTLRGVPENRRFYLVEEGGALFNGIRHGPLVRIRPELDGDVLTLALPDGTTVSGEIEPDARVETDFYGRPVHGRRVHGFDETLSGYAGRAVWLVRSDNPGDASDVHVATVLSRASCERLGEELDAEIDPRRFRMLFELDGCDAHEEDGWSGRLVRFGDAVLRIGGPVPRCAITTQDPDTGIRSLDTLRGIKSYRGLRDGRAIDFGVYAEVERPGRVRVGDAVTVL